MNIAHLLLGAAQEFRDVTALARGDAAYLSYRDFWRKVSMMSTYLLARFGLSPGRPCRDRDDQLRRIAGGDVRHLARGPLRGADERQAARQGIRLHPGEF